MKRAWRIALPMAAAAAALFAWGQLRGQTATTSPQAPQASQAATTSAQVQRGAYLARAADCIACHTTDAAKPFAGGVPFKTPFGTIYAPNITPDVETGIGMWSEADFRRALHEGVRRDGARLYPAFPYTSYTLLSDQDVADIRAYLFTQKPIRNEPPENALHFPFNVRFLMTFWNWFNFDEGRWHDKPDRPAQWNRGAYLVEGAGHCAECHTPRNFMQGLSSKGYEGAQIQGWVAFNITPDRQAGIGNWSQDDIVRYLKQGVAPGHAWAAGPMAEVIENSTQYLSEPDLQAMATYLSSLPARGGSGDAKAAARDRLGQPIHDVITLRGTNPSEGGGPASGAWLYVAHCASCHGWNGAGVGNAPGPTGAMPYPPLLHNSVTGARRLDNVVQVILHGVHRRANGHDAFMPAFGEVMSDADVASLASYIGDRFGAGDTVKANDVKRLREASSP